MTKHGKLLNVLRAGEPFGEMAYLSRNEHARGADVTVAADASIISVPTDRARTRPPRAAATSSTAPSWRSWSSA